EGEGGGVDGLVEGQPDTAHRVGGVRLGGRDAGPGDVGGAGVHRPVGVEPPPPGHRGREPGHGVGVVEDAADDVGVAQRPVLAADRGDHAGDVGGGHRGAAEVDVLAGLVGAGDGHPGGGDVHGAGAVVGEAGQLVLAVGGGHRDDVGHAVAGGVGGAGV